MTFRGKGGVAMRQIWMNRKGEVDVLEVREVARPDPGPGQVRVRVEAAGVNFADVMMRRICHELQDRRGGLS